MAHSDETNAAVTAALLAGQGVTAIAEQYNLPKSTVSRLKSRLTTEEMEQIGTKKGEKIESLVFGYLSVNFASLTEQAKVAGDEQYLKKYPPQQLAILHGVMADKAIRLLEAISNAGDSADIPTEEASTEPA